MVIDPFLCPLLNWRIGKISIIGGSFEYTGAPFYAAISSLKGVRLAPIQHIECFFLSGR
jgi:hypothetical protein